MIYNLHPCNRLEATPNDGALTLSPNQPKPAILVFCQERSSGGKGLNNLTKYFNFFVGPIPWFMMAELFPQGSRAAATSISGGVNWFTGFIVAITFPTIQVTFTELY